jgi:esterase
VWAEDITNKQHSVAMLNYHHYTGDVANPALLIIHGLFGSAKNWRAIGQRLADSYSVYIVDLRNHGDSPWFDTHSYTDMADDLAKFIDTKAPAMRVLGHSMGGKAAMMLGLTRPQLVDKLILADIAPVSYQHDQLRYINALKRLDLTSIQSRADAQNGLAAEIEDPALSAFFLQSLDVATKKWKLNLDVLARAMPDILAFPDVANRFEKDCLFLSGADSDYVTAAMRPQIKARFPKARLAKIPKAGHWLHADRPAAFEAAVRAFLG